MAQEKLSHVKATAASTAAKLGLAGLRAKLVLAIDTSRAMQPVLATPVVQTLVPSLSALALGFGEEVVSAFGFADTARALRDLHHEDGNGWVERAVVRGSDFARACRYAPLMNEVGRRAFGDESWKVRGGAKRHVPVMCVIVTAGEPEDESATAELVARSRHLPIFWQFVAFRSSRALARLKNAGDNIGVCELFDPRPDETLFTSLLGDLSDYLQADDVRAMIATDEAPRARPAKRKGATVELDLEEVVPRPKVVQPSPARRVYVSELHDRIHGPMEMQAKLSRDATAPVGSARRQRPSEAGDIPVEERKPDATQRVADRLARLRSHLTAGVEPKPPKD